MDLQDWRDVVIIAAGSLTILLLLAMFVFTVVLGLAARALLGAVRTLLNEEVTPLLGTAHQTVQKIQGTTTFMSETTVRPVVRAYGVIAGTRRMVAVLTGITGRRGKGG